jgi:prepilin-type processing-associated H-X9-DG protein
MDYASATPANTPNSWDQFWYGDIWGAGWVRASYRGVIVRGGLDLAGQWGPAGNWIGGKTQIGTISDGTSNTLLVSEKQLNSKAYFDGDCHDDCGWADGWDPDVIRYTGFQPNPDSVYGTSANGGWEGYRFGSAHSSGINGLFGDGSVRHTGTRST